MAERSAVCGLQCRGRASCILGEGMKRRAKRIPLQSAAGLIFDRPA